MKRLWLVLLAAGLMLLPFIAYGDAPEGKTPPPVAQTLVREGDFAISLAKSLDIVETQDEGEAEEALVKAGISPKSGWISDFPVTPDVYAEIKASVEAAAAAEKIDMSREDADNALYALSKEMGLPIVAAGAREGGKRGYVTGEEYAGEAPPEGEYEYQPPTVINNYYYEQGPPVVTYYPPPVDYSYLYWWNPYPFWWDNFFFPGFFVLRDFTTTVVVNNTGTVNISGDKVIVKGGTVNVNGSTVNTTTKLVTNRVVNKTTNKTVLINPVTRTATATSFGGRDTTFNRQSASNILGSSVTRTATIGGTRATGGTGVVAGGQRPAATGFGGRAVSSAKGSFDPSPSLRGRASSSARNSGAATVAPTFKRGGSFGGRDFDPAPSLRGSSGNRVTTGPSVMSRNFGGVRSQAPTPAISAPNRSFGGQSFGGRSFSAPSVGRSFSAPSAGRSFSAPSAGRSFSAPSIGGGRSMGSFGGRSMGGSGGGRSGSFGGGRR